MNTAPLILCLLLFILMSWSNCGALADEKDITSTISQAAQSKQAFLDAIANDFRRKYFPLPDFCNCVSQVSFTIEGAGKISSIKVVKPAISWKSKTSSQTNDEAMKEAVKNLNALPAFPAGMKEPVQILLTLDGRKNGPMRITASLISEFASNGK